MDQNSLVNSGQSLIQQMDKEDFGPRAAMWMHNVDVDTWRLWVVPQKNANDKRDFYRKIAEIISAEPLLSQVIDVSDVEMISDKHPAILGLQQMFRVEGVSSVHISNNKFNEYYMPDGIVLRMAL